MKIYDLATFERTFIPFAVYCQINILKARLITTTSTKEYDDAGRQIWPTLACLFLPRTPAQLPEASLPNV